MKLKNLLLALSGFGIIAAPSHAAVSFVGSLENNPNGYEIGNWSRGGVAKTYDIEIWAGKEATGGINAATIGGVMFDSVPEPSLVSLLGFGVLALIGRRRV